MNFQLFRRGNAAGNSINADTVAAMNLSQAVIEFEPDGTIVTANHNFLSVMGYDLDAVQGKHHSIFLDADYAASAEYRNFWSRLAAGEYQRAQFRRLGNGGAEVWIEASYNPLIGADGKVYRIVKLATDVPSDTMHHRTPRARLLLSPVPKLLLSSHSTAQF